MARPTKFSPEVAATICQAVEDGNYLVTAAAMAGVDSDTVYTWLEQGRKKGGPPEKREFLGALTRARAKAESVAVAAVVADMKGGTVIEETIWDEDGGRTTTKYAPPNGTLALKFLRVAFPDRWADRKAIDPPGEDEQGGMGAPSSIKVLAERLREEMNGAALSDGDEGIAEAEIVDTPG